MKAKIAKRCPKCGKTVFRLRSSGKCGPCTNPVAKPESTKRKYKKDCPQCGREVFRLAVEGLVCGDCAEFVDRYRPEPTAARERDVMVGKYVRQTSNHTVEVVAVVTDDDSGTDTVKYINPSGLDTFLSKTRFLEYYRRAPDDWAEFIKEVA